MSTGKCHRGVTWSCDSWWNPAILLNLSMLCWSIYNSCLKSLVSSKINFFVIVQRGISKTSLKALDVVLLSTSDSLKLYQFTTQVAPPFSEQYLQEGFWQLTEYLVADQEILRKTPTCLDLKVCLLLIGYRGPEATGSRKMLAWCKTAILNMASPMKNCGTLPCMTFTKTAHKSHNWHSK